ncbi:hypothetical protein HPB48_003554 [Haemaphysalis longicornis]|uniref:Uncharacterized protein n=1 Tax=Haemaphysalis longicornis TaxID=44386 RepID=A0A9J6FC71_HAELO|nr:hypothetical protein HPB48_003554 [Haemaphysalis longicornis]
MHLAPIQMMNRNVWGPHPVRTQQVPRFEEVCVMKQNVRKMYEEVREMPAKVQALKDERARELELFKKNPQEIKNEKGNYSANVTVI